MARCARRCSSAIRFVSRWHRTLPLQVGLSLARFIGILLVVLASMWLARWNRRTRAPHRASRFPQLADRAPEPILLSSGAGSGAGPDRRNAATGRGALSRPRPIQECQRYVRTAGRLRAVTRAGRDAAARHRHRLRLDLREALRGGQFRLEFQPIFDPKAERIGGFEVLLRWRHPTRGDVGPADNGLRWR